MCVLRLALIALLSSSVCTCKSLLFKDTQRHTFEQPSSAHGWLKGQRANPQHIVKILVGVRVLDPEALEKTFFDVSDPLNPHYGQHLTFEEAGDLIKNEEAVQSVIQWLNDAGLDDITPSAHGELVAVRGPIQLLERLLDTYFHEFAHSKYDVGQIIAAERYSMPQYLVNDSYGILGVLPLPLPSRRAGGYDRVSPTVLDDNNNRAIDIKAKRDNHVETSASKWSTKCPFGSNTGLICPEILQARYNIPTLSTSVAHKIGVYESGQEWSTEDTTLFFQEVVGEGSTAPTEFPVKCWDDSGCNITAECGGFYICGEANLDVQYILGLTNSLMDVDYTYQDSFDLVSWIEDIASESSPSSVYSISYGVPNEKEIDSATRSAFDTQAQKAGTLGVSIIVASGDYGANGENSDGSIICTYWADWPASSPYVTAVGATQGVEAGQTEVACTTVITSGGGFSSLYSRPSYQSSWVGSYLSSYESTLVSGFNSGGRAYPDVSMAGYNYVIGLAGNFTAVSGTSASTPVFAAMIALINTERAKSGKSNLGFLNTALYIYGKSILSQDITSGSNKCNAEIDVCCKTGFEAVVGWDPVTGLGSVDYEKLLKATNNATTQTGKNSISSSVAVMPNHCGAAASLLLLVSGIVMALQ